MRKIIIISMLLVLTLMPAKKYDRPSEEALDKMPRAPTGWSGGVPNKGISPWNPYHSGPYALRKGEKPPHRLIQDIRFFNDRERYYEHSSKFWTVVFYPYKWVWHWSSVVCIIRFQKMYGKQGHVAGSWWSHLHYKKDEWWVRGLILWLFYPFITLLYTLPFSWMNKKLDLV